MYFSSRISNFKDPASPYHTNLALAKFLIEIGAGDQTINRSPSLLGPSHNKFYRAPLLLLKFKQSGSGGGDSVVSMLEGGSFHSDLEVQPFLLFSWHIDFVLISYLPAD